MADDLTPEQRTAIGQRLLEGRKRATEARKNDPNCVVCRGDKMDEPGKFYRVCAEHVGQIVTVGSTANGHSNLLDIAEPAKWQMKVRVFLQTLDAVAADEWMEGFRMIATVAARVVRDQVYARVTGRCYVCSKPFKMGRPEGEAGYYDRDGTYIKVYCCHQAEYPELLKMVMAKEQNVKAAEERTAKAVRQAMIDVRGKAEREA